MEINKDILNKAIIINSIRDQEETYVIECRNAGLCPYCGENLNYKKYFGKFVGNDECEKCHKVIIME
jgi:hypothetical protein